MYLYNAQQIKAWDNFTIKEENISALELMERAGQRLTDSFMKLFPDQDIPIHIFCGNGNNGGDGLVMARILRHAFYTVKLYLCPVSSNSSKDFLQMLGKVQELSNVPCVHLRDSNDLPEKIDGIVIDALLGSGLNRVVDGLAAEVIGYMNRQQHCQIISIDLPSGMDIEQGARGRCVQANTTLTIQNMKLPFLFKENHTFTGNVELVDIGLSKRFNEINNYYYITEDLARSCYRKREKFSHKGNYGKALVIAGSEEMMGASVLAVKAMLKSGVGISYVASDKQHFVLFNLLCPELITLDISNFIERKDINAIGIGPGLGVDSNQVEWLQLVLQSKSKLVLDADALNIIAEHQMLSSVPPGTVLTPHPKEFDRLFGPHTTEYERWQKQKEVSQTYGLFIILKTAHTSISCPDGKVYFNSTGNPGMAKGGSGDVLTGFLCGLLAKMDQVEHACILSVYLHGLAGDLTKDCQSIEALQPSDLIHGFDQAWKQLLSGIVLT